MIGSQLPRYSCLLYTSYGRVAVRGSLAIIVKCLRHRQDFLLKPSYFRGADIVLEYFGLVRPHRWVLYSRR